MSSKYKLPETRYEEDADGLHHRMALYCPHSSCHETTEPKLELLQGVHPSCIGHKYIIRCNNCQEWLSNKNIMYYHCIAGCMDGTLKSHQYYLCLKCAEKHCSSSQFYVSPDSQELACRGLWTAFSNNYQDCEIMIMLQEANRVSCK